MEAGTWSRMKMKAGTRPDVSGKSHAAWCLLCEGKPLLGFAAGQRAWAGAGGPCRSETGLCRKEGSIGPVASWPDRLLIGAAKWDRPTSVGLEACYCGP